MGLGSPRKKEPKKECYAIKISTKYMTINNTYNPAKDPHLATWIERRKMGITKMRCPICKKIGYKPYIYPDGELIAECCGRCDHESSCGYSMTPKEYFKTHLDQRTKHVNLNYTPPPPPPPIKLPSSMVKTFFCLNPKAPRNPLLKYWYQMFDGIADRTMAEQYIKRFMEVLNQFAIGTNVGGKTIWWIVDENGWIRSGKAMAYKADGHRDKDKDNNNGFEWMHKYAPLFCKDFNPEAQYNGCLFGLHQLRRDDVKSIGIVESEKTAVMMSVFSPDVTWMATMGLNNLKTFYLKPLIERNLPITLYPDRDGIERWQEKMDEIKKESHYDRIYLNDAAARQWQLGDVAQADILDIIERRFRNKYYNH